jgi:hypothetical protein
MKKETYVLRWRTIRGVERPVVEVAKGDDLRYGLGRATKREVIESTMRSFRRRLEDHKDSIRSIEQSLALLEILLAKETPPCTP